MTDKDETIDSKFYYCPDKKEFYNFILHPDCKEITAERFSTIREKLKEGYVLSTDKSGMPVVIKPPPAIVVPPTIEEIYKTRVTQLNQEYEGICALIRGDYPVTETSTWPVQLSEAVAYKKWLASGSKPPQPVMYLLNALSEERDKVNVGKGLEDLADRVINNANLYNKMIAKATSLRHEAEKKLTGCLEANDLENMIRIKWDLKDTFK